jgi:signal transduction histidine kinase
MGFAELLRRCTDADTAKRYAQRVIDGVRQVDAIVRELLAFARPGRAANRRMSLGAAATEAAAAAGLPRARLTLRGALETDVEGAALVRVLANLLRNSVEAAGDTVTVDLLATRCGERLEIVVRDDGPGVPAELAARLFQPFVSTKARGTGLGLALATRVLGFLGGSLRLLNPGKPGAAFAIVLSVLAEAGDGATA